MNRNNISTMYSDNIFEQLGGKPSNKIDTYVPSDMSLKDQSSTSKLIKENRELHRDLDRALTELKLVKKQLELTKSKLNRCEK
mgnify:CR=1 FL=1|jgi:hypothetical protein|tara:strand:- start:30 stop:278 length:249 start_codon:yes stop_codon:yes gene_type:complete